MPASAASCAAPATGGYALFRRDVDFEVDLAVDFEARLAVFLAVVRLAAVALPVDLEPPFLDASRLASSAASRSITLPVSAGFSSTTISSPLALRSMRSITSSR